MPDRKVAKVFIIKYALTQGIQEAEAEVIHDQTPGRRGMICIRSTARACNWDQYLHGENQEYDFTREAAVRAAEEKRAKKVSSLLKQISRLQDLKF